jgi:NADH-quinone oxidoreductase subunit G
MSAQPVNPNTPPDHVNIEIDGVAMTAPKGSMIIHASDKAGIPTSRRRRSRCRPARRR